MGLRFIPCDRDHSFLMPPDLRDWLPENHLAWFVLAAVEEMDPGAVREGSLLTQVEPRHQDRAFCLAEVIARCGGAHPEPSRHTSVNAPSNS